MTQTLDLNKMGLAPLSGMEMKEVEGGNFITDYIVGKALDLLIDYASREHKKVLIKLGPSAMDASMMFN